MHEGIHCERNNSQENWCVLFEARIGRKKEGGTNSYEARNLDEIIDTLAHSKTRRRASEP